MKRLIIIVLNFFWVCMLLAQKPVLTSKVYDSWRSVAEPLITDNGEFVSYNILNFPTNSQTTIFQSTTGKWEKDFQQIYRVAFTHDSKYAYFLKGKDSLAFLSLGKNTIKYILGVSGFQLKSNYQGEWLCYTLSDQTKTLILKDLKTGKQSAFNNVDYYWLSENGHALIVKTRSKENAGVYSLTWMNTCTMISKLFWEGSDPTDLVFNAKSNQIAFKTDNDIWHFKAGNAKAKLVLLQDTVDVKQNLSFGDINGFSKDDERLYLTFLKKNDVQHIQPGVQLWSYIDVKLRSEDENQKGFKSFLYTLHLSNKSLSRIQLENDTQLFFPKDKLASDSLILVEASCRLGEQWSKASKSEYSLVSTKNGRRMLLPFLKDNRTVTISSMGKFLVYYDFDRRSYHSYDIKNGIDRVLAEKTDVSWVNSNSDFPKGCFDIKWIDRDNAFLICDQNDIWKLDPLGIKEAVNLTNGYGLKHNVVFDFAMFNQFDNEECIVTAFNNNNKNNGFYQININRSGDPVLLTMGPYIFKTNSPFVQNADFEPLKAKNATMFLVQRMSATDAPNYFSTRDFKKFKQLSNLGQEKSFNWYTTELVNWKSLDGSTLQGILYKPENFDPANKYPIIFNYYERKSDRLNVYIKPEPLCDMCNLNISTYVSNGYLVFTPDIYYQIGDPMQGAYNSIISAATYLSALPYVDPSKMGLQGCSFGGIETNYIVTHSSIFKVACTVSGLADWVGSYASLQSAGASNQNNFEKGQLRMGGNLWDNKSSFLKNSTILMLDKITTPLLIMHTKNDAICPLSDAIDYFVNLRRLGKKSWLLIYPEGNHGVWGEEANDFSIRMRQFFDHYLKDASAPIWMLTSSSECSLSEGLELDTTGRTPGPGLLAFP